MKFDPVDPQRQVENNEHNTYVVRVVPLNADPVPATDLKDGDIWYRGDLNVLKAKINGTIQTLVPADDQTLSNYFDIGTMRIQWGSEVITVDSPVTVTLPAPFANVNYSIGFSFDDSWSTGGTVQGPLRWEAGSKTTTQFQLDRDDDVTGTINVDWIVIGLKP